MNETKITPELCEFIGVLIGDGFLAEYPRKNHPGLKHRYIEIAGHFEHDRHYFCEYLIPLIVRNFNVKPRFYECPKNTIRLKINSHKIFLEIRDNFEFPVGPKSYKIKIPEKIINSNKENLYACIRGIWDTDGCIFFDKRERYKNPYPRLTIQIASKPLQAQLISILSKDFKLHYGCGKEPKRNFVEIYGHDQLRKWISLIGFSNQKHLQRLRGSVVEYHLGKVGVASSTLAGGF